MPSLRIEDAVAAAGSVDVRAAKKKDRVQRGPAAMSHISGVKRPLTHTNSFTGERVPLHGVETPHEEELGKVRAPLTSLTFNVLPPRRSPTSLMRRRSWILDRMDRKSQIARTRNVNGTSLQKNKKRN